MNTFKSHFGVIFPLLILLFSIEFSVMASKIVSEYESSMSDDYSIVVVSSAPLKHEELKAKIPTFKEAVALDPKPVMDRLKGDLSEKSLKDLAQSLPRFYSIKLNNFPSPDFMAKIGRDLGAINGVSKVETFSKTHDKIYRILVIFKAVAQAFTLLIALLGITLIFKQMRIWLYEHKRRIEVMTELGAPYWLKSAMLYKMAIIDSFLATFVVCVLYFYMPFLLENTMQSMGFAFPKLDVIGDAPKLFGASIVVSIIAVSLVMIRTRTN